MASHFAVVSSRHAMTLRADFSDPVSPQIEWQTIEALLVAGGCRVVQGAGSRVGFERDGVVASLHRPHPAKEAMGYQVRDARDFLSRIAVAPSTR